MVECGEASEWRTTVSRLEAGRYRLSFFYRAYAPDQMTAKHRPGRVGRVSVAMASGSSLISVDHMEFSFQWQKGSVDFDLPVTGDVVVCVAATSSMLMDWTGFDLQPTQPVLTIPVAR